MKIYLLSFVLLITAFGCEKNQLTPDQDLAGYWINPQWDNSGLVIYDRADGFVEGYGIAFFEDGSLLERKNEGWCGTPPISYGDFTGTWEEQEEDIIKINSTYWGGTLELTWKIISVDETTLVVEIID